MTENLKVIGSSPFRQDAVEKVTGKAMYSADYHPAELAYAKLLLSPYAHARILSIDTSEAERLPGVLGILTGKDVTDERLGGYYQDRHALCNEYVRYVGDFVAFVAAQTEDIAQAAVNLIKVEYEVLPHVMDVEEAYRADCPVVVHKDFDTYKVKGESPIQKEGEFSTGDGGAVGIVDREHKNQNVCTEINYGDVEQGFAQADLIVENRYVLPRASHCCMEPNATTVVPDADGGITVYTTEQAKMLAELDLSVALGLAPSQIRFNIPYLGGAFGGKSGNPYTRLVAQMALKLQRPVHFVETREENFVSGSPRASAVVYLKDGYQEDGTLVARTVDLFVNIGAYASEAVMVIGALYGGTGSYRVPNLRLTSHGVYTNTPPTGPYRSLGAELLVFAIERNTDIAAKKLGIDVGTIRLKNVLVDGDEDGLGQITYCNRTREALERSIESIKLDERRPPEGPWVFGKGVSVGNKFTNFGPTGTGAICRILPDGTIELKNSHIEMGQGAATVDAMAVAETFHTTTDRIRVLQCRSDCPYDEGTYCSRGTFLHGNAGILAAEDAKRQVFEIASRIMQLPAEALDTENCEVYEKANPENRIPFFMLYQFGGWLTEGAEIIGKATYSHPLGFTCVGERDLVVYYSYGAWGIEVAVNRETGEVRLMNLEGNYDGGRIVNLKAAEAQIEGSFSMGLGQAVYEEELFNMEGRVINANYRDYKIPTFMDGPRNADLRYEFVGQPHKDGPYGAKGLGEVAMTPVMPAVANAINDALGVELLELPLSRERIYQAVRTQLG